MRDHLLPRLSSSAMLLLLAACGDRSTLSPGADVGAHPVLVSPVKTLIPTVDIAPARGWPQGGKPPNKIPMPTLLMMKTHGIYF